MYRAKGAGGHNLELFNEDLRREASARLELEDRLDHALPRHELLLEYQPLLPLGGGRPVGCEALVRWHPHGAESDGRRRSFLSLAEEGELIVQIGDWVLHAACAQAAAWRRDGIEIPVSVNISARELTGVRPRRAGAGGAAVLPAAGRTRCAWRSARRWSCAIRPARARR